jgi:hypothetical protein
MISKRTRIIVASLEEQGAKVIELSHKKGHMVRFKDGSSLTMHNTESDPRAEANTRSRVLRAGLKWPFDGEKRGR